MTLFFTVSAFLLLILAAFLAAVLRTRPLARAARAAVPPAGRIMPVTGGAIHYVELGNPDAPPLVLIHGLSGQLQHFTCAMTQDLARDFRVIALDRPGCGYSRRDDDSLADPSVQARMIWQFLDAILVSQPVIAGHSLGGAIALAMALDRPGQARALALIAPLTHPTPETPDSFKGLRVRSALMRRLIGHTLAVPMAKATATQVLTQVFAPEPCPDSFMSDAGAALGLRPEAFIAASADITAAERAIPDQARAYAHADLPPGAVLFGTEDAILSPATHGEPMQDYGFDLELLTGAGHMLPITRATDCIRFVRETAQTAKLEKSA